MKTASVALIQMVSTDDLDANLVQAADLLHQAAEQGALIAVLPENFAIFQSPELRRIGMAESEPGGGVIQAFLREQSRRLGLWVVAGSLPLGRRPDGTPVPDGRVRPACLVYNPDGEMVARYDKIHLFDAAVGDKQKDYRESRTFEAGDRPVSVMTPAGNLGLSICYDLRFPELYRQLRAMGAEWIVVPSAFTYETGQAHWEALLRARAIENQCWICAPNQGGWHDNKRRTWGHSMVIDPWGGVVAVAEEGPQVLMATLEPAILERTRTDMPVWSHRRLSD